MKTNRRPSVLTCIAEMADNPDIAMGKADLALRLADQDGRALDNMLYECGAIVAELKRDAGRGQPGARDRLDAAFEVLEILEGLADQANLRFKGSARPGEPAHDLRPDPFAFRW